MQTLEEIVEQAVSDATDGQVTPEALALRLRFVACALRCGALVEGETHWREVGALREELDTVRRAAQALLPSSGLSEPQPPPAPQAGPAVWSLVLRDMLERDAVGERKYGTRLRAGDGRDSLVDAYQEVLDLAVYLRKAIAERASAGLPGSPR